ncbi:MAG: hypothetical protein M1832_001214 [Thelocarpon impressellum]|nr:MAG: hypothetical protein M1832_001214 [Thelocarpon impressellum]
MILGQVSYLDCIVFLVFLAPQLLLQVGLWRTLICGLYALPFLLLQLPVQFLWARYLTRREHQVPFVRQASVFQDVVIRCVRYAFAQIPASIGRVFFSKRVALPFLRFRMLRHGYLRSPIYWREVDVNGVKGIWITVDELEPPDTVVYYCHGGGFSMGSSYFYLEFLLAWVTLLKDAGFRNPALFSLEYTLVPNAVYPTQLHETLAGYDYVLSRVPSSSPSCVTVAGDSAGAALILGLLLRLAEPSSSHKRNRRRPAFATLISPWSTLLSPKNRDTASDYLSARTLHAYACQYIGAGEASSPPDPVASPGTCKDLTWWSRAAPSEGFAILFGAEEVFAEESRDLVRVLRKAGASVDVTEEEGGIHAWPVATLFLGDTRAERQKGLKQVVDAMARRLLG